jgi:hypothetical protein
MFTPRKYFASLCIIYLLLLKEEIAAVNLSKYRRAQGELEDAEDRAESSESSLYKMRFTASNSSFGIFKLFLLIIG